MPTMFSKKGADLAVGDLILRRGQRRRKKENYVWEVDQLNPKRAKLVKSVNPRVYTPNRFMFIDNNFTYDVVK